MLLIRLYGTFFAFALLGLFTSALAMTFYEVEPKWAIKVFNCCATAVIGTIVLVVVFMLLMGLWND